MRKRWYSAPVLLQPHRMRCDGSAGATISFSNSNSLLFDGVDEYVDLGATAIHPEKTDTFTFSAWFRMQTLSGFPTIVAAMNAAYSLGFAVAVHSTQQVIYFQHNVLGTSIYVWGSTVLTTNTWYHVVVLSRGTQAASGYDMYINGALQTPNVRMNSMGVGTAVAAVSAKIGKDDSGDILTGNIDEVSYWNKAFDSTEVAALYNSGAPADLNSHSAAANLVNWYRMGDGDTYPTIIDVKGGQNGTMTNMESGDIAADVP